MRSRAGAVPPPGLVNIANALTMLRLVLVPVFVLLLLAGGTGWRIAAFVVFAVASVTDLLDGELARRRSLITDFGKIADPIADKALTGSALVTLSALGELPWWVTGVILFRELARHRPAVLGHPPRRDRGQPRRQDQDAAPGHRDQPVHPARAVRGRARSVVMAAALWSRWSPASTTWSGPCGCTAAPRTAVRGREAAREPGARCRSADRASRRGGDPGDAAPAGSDPRRAAGGDHRAADRAGPDAGRGRVAHRRAARRGADRASPAPRPRLPRRGGLLRDRPQGGAARVSRPACSTGTGPSHPEVAAAMAEGARRRLAATVGVATTGRGRPRSGRRPAGGHGLIAVSAGPDAPRPARWPFPGAGSRSGRPRWSRCSACYSACCGKTTA